MDRAHRVTCTLCSRALNHVWDQGRRITVIKKQDSIFIILPCSALDL